MSVSGYLGLQTRQHSACSVNLAGADAATAATSPSQAQRSPMPQLLKLILWPVLLFDVLLWVILMPIVCAAVWCVGRLALLVAGKPRPIFLDTPWETLQSWFLVFHGIRVVDADGAHTWRLPNVEAIEGAVLTNHRSWGDFVFDPAMAFAPVVARTAAVAATLVAGVIGLACGKVVMINRGKTSRAELRDRCATLRRYLIYPEGTRRANLADADEPGALRPGGLKNVYESGHAAHIVVTVNKECIWNEKKGVVSCRTTLYRARCPKPVLPAEHATFDGFVAAVEDKWKQTWARAYALRHSHEVAASAPSSSDNESVVLV